MGGWVAAKYMDEKLFIVLYKALIRPLLEYGNVVWKPYFKKDYWNYWKEYKDVLQK